VTALATRLAQGITTLKLNLPTQTQHQLLTYLSLLEKWNRTHNLTAIRTSTQMLDLHLLDSLVILPLLQQLTPGPRLLDLGSGAGLPGIIIAIAAPHYHLGLLDANSKKCRFLTHVKIQLGLPNVEVINQRAKKHHPTKPYDLILTRAFASLPDMTDNSRHLLQPQGRFLAMKGQYPATEIAQLNTDYRLMGVHRLHPPNPHQERHLIDIAFKK